MGALSFYRQTTVDVFRANVQLSILAVNTNSNAVTTTIAFDPPNINEIAGLSVLGNRIDLPVGKYETTFISNTSTLNPRVSHAVRLKVNGVDYSISEGSDYKRVSERHIRSSTTFVDVFVLNAAGFIEYELVQGSGGSGGITTIQNSSIVGVKRI